MLEHIRGISAKVAGFYNFIRLEIRNFRSFPRFYVLTLPFRIRHWVELKVQDGRTNLRSNLKILNVCFELMALCLISLIIANSYARSVPEDKHFSIFLIAFFLGVQLFYSVIIFFRAQKRLMALRENFDLINSQEAIEIIGKSSDSFFFWRYWLVKSIFPRQVNVYHRK